jgi:hypothetical protein
VSEDERPILTLETSADGLDRDAGGTLVARALAICDLVQDQSITLMGELRRRRATLAASSEPDPAGVALLDRYAAELAELDYGIREPG